MTLYMSWYFFDNFEWRHSNDTKKHFGGNISDFVASAVLTDDPALLGDWAQFLSI